MGKENEAVITLKAMLEIRRWEEIFTKYSPKYLTAL